MGGGTIVVQYSRQGRGYRRCNEANKDGGIDTEVNKNRDIVDATGWIRTEDAAETRSAVLSV